MDVFYLFLGLLVIGIYLFVIAIGLVDYIIGSLAMMRIARKRGVSNPWLAWIPIASEWIFGSVVDDFESERGSKRKFRVILLTLALVVLALSVLMTIVLLAYGMIMAVGYGIPTGDEEIAVLISYLAAVLPLSFISLAYYAINIICLNKLHENIYPEKSIKYTVVSLIVPLGRSICLLKNSKRCEEKVVFEPSAPVVAAEPEVIVEEITEQEEKTEE